MAPSPPIQISQTFYDLYPELHDEDGYYPGDTFTFKTVDDFINDLRTRMTNLLKSPVHLYYHGDVHGYELDSIEFDGVDVHIRRVRQPTPEEIQTREKAKQKAAARRLAAAEKKKKAELELLQRLKNKYENQVQDIQT